MLVALLLPLGATPLQKPAPEGKITVNGVVTDPTTGTPVPNATIQLIVGNPGDRPAHSATTRDDGNFTVKDVTEGRYRITVSRPGFTTPKGFEQSNVGDFPGYCRVLTLTAQTSSIPIRLSLIRASTISGRVFDERGDPRSSVTMLLLEKGYNSSGEPILTQATGTTRTRTDDRGEYEFRQLRPGEYYISAEGGTPRVVPTFYPNAATMEHALPVVVGEGRDVGGIDLKTGLERGVNVKLKLTGTQALPPESFDFKDKFGSSFSANWKDAGGGTFLLSAIPRGDYDMSIFMALSNPVRLFSHRIHISVSDRDMDLGTVNVNSQVSVPGRVRVPLGAAIPQGVQLFAIDNGIGVPPFARVQSDGSFLLEGVSLGRYVVSPATSNTSDFYIKSVIYGSRQVDGTGFTIDGPPPGPLEITMDQPAGKVEGIVRDAKNEPVAYGRVVLVPDIGHRGNPTLYLYEITDEQGRFSFARVPPSQYSALSWQYTPPNAYKNAEFLERYLKSAVTVDVKGGMPTSVELRSQQ